jgi:hypothetical protein
MNPGKSTFMYLQLQKSRSFYFILSDPYPKGLHELLKPFKRLYVFWRNFVVGLHHSNYTSITICDLMATQLKGSFEHKNAFVDATLARSYLLLLIS